MARSSLLDTIKNDPATKALAGNLGSYAAARVAKVGQPKDKAENSPTPSAVGVEGVGVMDKIKGGAMSGAGEAMQSGTSKVFGGLKGAVKGLFSRKGKAAKRPTNIYEDYLVPRSAQDTYEAWKDYDKHAGYMKGVEKVDLTPAEGDNPEQTNWTAKIFLNRRSWKATTEEDVPNERIRWKSEGNKGTVDGMVAFIPEGENACRFVYILEYRPKGFFEWWGNRWRTVGRRSRLDVKHFIRNYAMEDLTQEQPDTPEQEEPVSDEPGQEEEPEQEAPAAQPEPEPAPEEEEAGPKQAKSPKAPVEVDR